MHGQLRTELSDSIVMDSALTRRHAAFKVCGDTGPANVILSLSLAHAARCLVSAAHVRKTTSAQLQPRIGISHSRRLAGPVAQLGWSITHTGCGK